MQWVHIYLYVNACIHVCMVCLPFPASKSESQTKQSGWVCKQSRSSSAFCRQTAPSDRHSTLPTVDRLFVCSRILRGPSAAGTAAAGRLSPRVLCQAERVALQPTRTATTAATVRFHVASGLWSLETDCD